MNEETEQTGLPDSVEDQDDNLQELEEAEDQELEETETEDDGESESEDEEVDYEGKKFRVPKEIKDALLRQADYTQKTQGLAAERRAVQAQALALHEQAQFQEAAVEQMARIKQVDEQLERYSKVDWQALSAENPHAAQQHWIAYQQAKEQRGRMAEGMSNMYQMFQQRTEAARHAQLEHGLAEISKEIPNFKEVAPKLIEIGQKMGFTKDELNAITDPRAVKLLHRAYLYDQLEAKTKQQGVAKKAESQQPVASIKAKTSGTARIDLVKDAGKLSADEWARRRNAEIQARNKQPRR